MKVLSNCLITNSLYFLLKSQIMKMKMMMNYIISSELPVSMETVIVSLVFTL